MNSQQLFVNHYYMKPETVFGSDGWTRKACIARDETRNFLLLYRCVICDILLCTNILRPSLSLKCSNLGVTQVKWFVPITFLS